MGGGSLVVGDGHSTPPSEKRINAQYVKVRSWKWLSHCNLLWSLKTVLCCHCQEAKILTLT